MCGIFGCIGSIKREKAQQCIEQIKHRGPDALQVRQLDGGATLAHARLSIIDLGNDSNQPMQSLDGHYWIVYNGEIYNFVELKKELSDMGYRFRTNSDTEVALNAYIAWGADFQNKCNGMWALAIWDSLKRELFLSRDRFGIKPLYWYREDGNFYFASEMKAFFPIMKQRKENSFIFEQKDLFQYEATEGCVIKGIKRFPAGYCATLVNGELRKVRWWDTLEHLMEVPQSYDEQVEMLRELFLDACKIRMRSDVPIGTALSGGIDSSCTVGAMHYCAGMKIEKMSDDWQHAFVAAMPDTVVDEVKYADKAAQSIGIEAEHVLINPNIGEKELLRYIYLCEDPYITSPVPFIQTYGKISESGIKVTLDGHGADELFGGYTFDLPIACMDADDEKSIGDIAKTYNEASLSENRITVQQAPKIAISLEKQRLQYKFKNETYEKMDELNKWLYIETHRKVLPTILRCYDRYSMANGLEIRMPFMDYRIVSFAFSIPWTSKVRNGFTKSIVRDMARPFMSKEILDRKLKIGFNAPMTDWFQGELREFLLDTVHSKDFRECGIVNALDVCADVDEFMSSHTNRFQDGERIWGKIVPYLWKKALIA